MNNNINTNNLTILNSPPVINFNASVPSSPIENEGTYIYSNITDIDNDVLLVNISLGDILIYNNTNAVSGNYSINWTTMSIGGEQNISVIVWENETLDKYNATDSINVTLGIDTQLIGINTYVNTLLGNCVYNEDCRIEIIIEGDYCSLSR
jgi:hypothetical protein